MARLEYKAVAMPQLMAGRRRRGQGAAEQIAELVSKVINAQAERGWTYSGSDDFKAIERPQWWSRQQEVTYTVLLFEREPQGETARVVDEEAEAPIAEPAPRRRAAPSRAAPARLEEDLEDDAFAPAPTPALAPRRGRAEPQRGGGLFGDRTPAEDRGGYEDDYEDDGYADDRPAAGRFAADDYDDGYEDDGFDERDRDRGRPQDDRYADDRYSDDRFGDDRFGGDRYDDDRRDEPAPSRFSSGRMRRPR